MSTLCNILQERHFFLVIKLGTTPKQLPTRALTVSYNCLIR